MMDTTGSATGDFGYVCGGCGTWIPTGTYHACTGVVPWSNPRPVFAPRDKQDRVIELLEEILRELRSR